MPSLISQIRLQVSTHSGMGHRLGSEHDLTSFMLCDSGSFTYPLWARVCKNKDSAIFLPASHPSSSLPSPTFEDRGCASFITVSAQGLTQRKQWVCVHWMNEWPVLLGNWQDTDSNVLTPLVLNKQWLGEIGFPVPAVSCLQVIKLFPSCLCPASFPANREP